MLTLFEVKLKFTNSYDTCYVIANCTTQAYNIVREYFDEQDLGLEKERNLESIKIIAENYKDTNYSMLFINRNKELKKELNIPDGKYCQKSDGSVDCIFYRYDVDPLAGTRFYCDKYCNDFDVPFDNKRICDKRDIKKCKQCKTGL
jgi:hypothetical protein